MKDASGTDRAYWLGSITLKESWRIVSALCLLLLVATSANAQSRIERASGSWKYICEINEVREDVDCDLRFGDIIITSLIIFFSKKSGVWHRPWISTGCSVGPPEWEPMYRVDDGEARPVGMLGNEAEGTIAQMIRGQVFRIEYWPCGQGLGTKPKVHRLPLVGFRTIFCAMIQWAGQRGYRFGRSPYVDGRPMIKQAEC